MYQNIFLTIVLPGIVARGLAKALHGNVEINLKISPAELSLPHVLEVLLPPGVDAEAQILLSSVQQFLNRGDSSLKERYRSSCLASSSF